LFRLKLVAQKIITSENPIDFEKDISQKYKELTFKKWLMFTLFFLAIISSFIILIEYIQNKNFINDFIPSLIVINIFIFLSMLLNWRPSLVWWITTSVTTIILLVIVVQMFNPIVYSEFLRIIKYGGGIEITLTSNSKDAISKVQTGYLLLRTEKSLFLYNNQDNDIYEMNWKDIKSIRHKVAPKFKLPQIQEIVSK